MLEGQVYGDAHVAVDEVDDVAQVGPPRAQDLVGLLGGRGPQRREVDVREHPRGQQAAQHGREGIASAEGVVEQRVVTRGSSNVVRHRAAT